VRHLALPRRRVLAPEGLPGAPDRRRRSGRRWPRTGASWGGRGREPGRGSCKRR
jgi:hypothetical protein